MASRFEEYCRRKTAAALTARIAGFTTVRAPDAAPRGMAAIGNEWSRRLFDGWFYRTTVDEARGVPALSLVFVQSADRNTGAEDPASLGAGDTDKHLVYEGLARVDADAVLAGTATAAGDETIFSIWHPELVSLRASLGHARHPAQIILTNRGQLPVQTALLYNAPSLRVIVIASTAGALVLHPRLEGRPWVEVIDAGNPVDIRRALRELRARGINVISAIGGRSTAAALFDARAVCDLYLTGSAKRGGQPGTPLVEGALPDHRVLLEKKGREHESGVRWEHLTFET